MQPNVLLIFSPVSVSLSTQLRRRLRNERIEASDVTPTSEMEGQISGNDGVKRFHDREQC